MLEDIRIFFTHDGAFMSTSEYGQSMSNKSSCFYIFTASFTNPSNRHLQSATVHLYSSNTTGEWITSKFQFTLLCGGRLRQWTTLSNDTKDGGFISIVIDLDCDTLRLSVNSCWAYGSRWYILFL